jgi:hypothetical protein
VENMTDLNEYIETTKATVKLNYHVEHVFRTMREDSLKGIKIDRAQPVQRKSLEEYVARTASMSKNDPRRTK